MVLTITVVGNGQGNGNGNGNQAVLSPNELAQLMSGQTVTGLLNPDGSITLNSNVMSAQQQASMSANMQNGPTTTINNPTASSYQNRVQVEQLSTTSSNSISNIQAISNDSMNPTANNHSQTTNATTTQKKTGQKRLSAKQKLAQQQQQQSSQIQVQQQQQMQQMQPSDARNIIGNPTDQPMNHQPQIVATVQLPNGQIGQLIAPSGGQFWSPNAINLQQLSMAVAAATGTMPQSMSIPTSSSSQMGQQINNSNMQQQPVQNSGQLPQASQQSQQQQSSSQSLNQNQQQVLHTAHLTNNQMGQVVGRPGQIQNSLGGQISFPQLSALAQHGVVQVASVMGPNGQRFVEIPQSSMSGVLNQNGTPLQIPLLNGNQLITQDPNDPGKWLQIIPSTPVSNQPTTTSVQSSSTNNSANNDSSATISRNVGSASQHNSTTQNTILNDNAQSTQPQRKLKRLACTCPNCRDGDNNRNNSDKKKQHICHFPDCNKVYGKTSHLRAHLRWHSGERPYVCNWSFCGKKFTRSDELQRHRRTHTGEKRFQCSECLKRFMRSDHLSKHLKTHLSSKKSGTSQQQANGLPTIVTLSQDSDKLNEDMIDDLALQTMDKSNKQ